MAAKSVQVSLLDTVRESNELTLAKFLVDYREYKRDQIAVLSSFAAEQLNYQRIVYELKNPEDWLAFYMGVPKVTLMGGL